MTNVVRGDLAVPDGHAVSLQPYFGAFPETDGVRFRVWAPAATKVILLVRDADGESAYTPRRLDEGVWELFVPGLRAGARYAYALDDHPPRPDPASRFQPDGVHGWSEIVDAFHYEWHDAAWSGIDPARAVLYELHVGTFSGDGTFASVAERLEYLRDLGITAIELMPVADFPGNRNWGYDGVALFAPSRAYGRPDDLRALIDRAHGLGLGVVIDVVYNHLGPEGAYLPLFSPEFLTQAHTTPWGKAVNLDSDGCRHVRRFLIENAVHWIREYHADGLRLDATHALIDTSDAPFVRELTAAVHQARAGAAPLVFAEDHRNLAVMVTDVDRGGWGLDGVWADDFHHIVRRVLGEEAHSYFADYSGHAPELAETLRRGWLFIGQPSKHHRGPRGTDPSDVPLRKSVIAIQNHDQIGNRALGDRLHHGVDPAEYRAAVTLLLTAPMTPLLFMGQEWAASTPFQFFTDFEPHLGALVIEGRRREFRAFPGFSSDAAAERVPNPQAASTFDASRLEWQEQSQPAHASALALHRALLKLRATYPALRGSDAGTCDATALDDDTVLVNRPDPASSTGTRFLVCIRLRGAGRVPLDLRGTSSWRVVLSTEDDRFAPDPEPIRIEDGLAAVSFSRPGALMLSVDPDRSSSRDAR